MRIYKFSSLVLMCAAIAAAQNKLTVPLSNPSQPATVKVQLITGSITVTAGGGSQVVVEQSGRESRRSQEAPAGMHRLEVGPGSLDVQEDHNVVSIESGHYTSGENLAVQVPANSSLQLKTVNGGHIEVTGVSGEIEAEDINGSITLRNVSGSVVASSQNGSITVSLDKITPTKPMSFTTLNGKIDVTIPGDTKARLRLKTENGSVFSDFDVKMEPDVSKPVVEDARGQGGKYRIRMDRNVYGSINGGGPEYRFETMNGSILIHKK
jgi:DUF4097 and DUF4098 domain-containing protein YvlB